MAGMIPLMTSIDSDGAVVFTLTPDDYEKARQGYACTACLEDYNGIWQPKCPVCGAETLEVRPGFWKKPAAAAL